MTTQKHNWSAVKSTPKPTPQYYPNPKSMLGHQEPENKLETKLEHRPGYVMGVLDYLAVTTIAHSDASVARYSRIVIVHLCANMQQVLLL